MPAPMNRQRRLHPGNVFLAKVYSNLMLPGADGSLQPVDGVDVIETDDGRIAVKDAADAAAMSILTGKGTRLLHR